MRAGDNWSLRGHRWCRAFLALLLASVVPMAFTSGAPAVKCAGCAAAQSLPEGVARVVEFHNAALDHYFLAVDPDEVRTLDEGMPPGWARTGYGFRVWTGQTGTTVPVCRFYIPPAYGDSHFYSASPVECEIAPVVFPWLIWESEAAFYIDLPDAVSGACPGDLVPVYRLWNGRSDSNHRYTTSPSVRAAMMASGFIPEGYGPSRVAMCALPPEIIFLPWSGQPS